MTHTTDKPHHVLSPSSAHRWLNCTASAMAEAALPEANSAYADEGSEAHDLAAHCLENALHGVDVTDNTEMAEAIQVYLDYVRAIPGARLVEQKLDLGSIIAGMFGTADCIVLDARGGILHVVDFKFGQGVVIDAENNEQLLLYAAGALDQFGFLAEFTTVRLAIVQPRRDHISEWTVAVGDIEAFVASARAKAAEALSDKATFAPSVTACRFCRAAGDCDALAKHAFKTVAEGFEDLGEIADMLAEAPIAPDDVSTYTVPVLGHKLDQIPLIKAWLEAVEARATKILEDGGTVPGYKLVESRTHRRWKDETSAEAALRGRKLKVADIFKKSLISPAQAEKLLGRGHPIFEDLVVSPKGRPVLAPESDKRPAYRDTVASGFEDLDNTTSDATPNQSQAA